MKLPLFLLGWLVAVVTASAQDLLLMPQRTVDNLPDNAIHLSWSGKGTYHALTTLANTVEISNAEFGQVWRYQGNPRNNAGNTTFSPDEKYLFLTRYLSRGDVAVLRLADQKIVALQKIFGDEVRSLSLSPDGRFLALGGTEPVVHILEFKDEKLVPYKKLDLPTESFQSAGEVHFSPDGKQLAVGGTMDGLRFYTVGKGDFTFSYTLPTRKHWISTLAFHPDGKGLVYFTSEGLYRAQRQGDRFTLADSLDPAGGSPYFCSFSPDGRYLAEATGFGTVNLWRWNSGKLQAAGTLEMHQDAALIAAFSPDGRWLATGGADKKLIFWEMPDAPAAKVPSRGTTPAKPEKGEKPNSGSAGEVEFDPATTGKNYLLLIAINQYKFWNPLGNATRDAADVKKTLLDRYTFALENVSELYNEDATAVNMLARINELKKKITAQDNLLIYFSGHGHYNAEIEEGFWIPVDAHKGQETEYLANSTLLKYIRSIPARHIFLVADACFSGALFAPTNRGYLENVEQYRSRWGLASGRLEFVSDGQSGSNSPFAGYFIRFLRENQKARVAVSEVIQYVKTAVANNSEQTPVGQPLKGVGDEGGEMIFYLKK